MLVGIGQGLRPWQPTWEESSDEVTLGPFLVICIPGFCQGKLKQSFEPWLRQLQVEARGPYAS